MVRIKIFSRKNKDNIVQPKPQNVDKRLAEEKKESTLPEFARRADKALNEIVKSLKESGLTVTQDELIMWKYPAKMVTVIAENKKSLYGIVRFNAEYIGLFVLHEDRTAYMLDRDSNAPYSAWALTELFWLANRRAYPLSNRIENDEELLNELAYVITNLRIAVDNELPRNLAVEVERTCSNTVNRFIPRKQRKTFNMLLIEKRAQRISKFAPKIQKAVQARAEIQEISSRTKSWELPRGKEELTINDVGDMDEVKKKLRENVEWPLIRAHDFKSLGIIPPHGVLLYGPPGTGKTYVMKALANTLNVTFFYVRCSEILTKWFGESELKIREIFDDARKKKECIIFFDEFDALAPRRGTDDSAERAMNRVVSELLVEMDGFVPLEGVVLVAATNRPDLIDPALLRPGRFDVLIYVPPPDEKARLEILKVVTSKMPLAADVDLEYLAKELNNYSPADITALCREAGLNAMHRNDKQVTAVDFEVAKKSVKPSITVEDLRKCENFATRLH
jgi:SpoVK/Ycf46/Vps4 family AAA+-type ATPase